MRSLCLGFVLIVALFLAPHSLADEAEAVKQLDRHSSFANGLTQPSRR
jgi:hypothetical protein